MHKAENQRTVCQCIAGQAVQSTENEFKLLLSTPLKLQRSMIRTPEQLGELIPDRLQQDTIMFLQYHYYLQNNYFVVRKDAIIVTASGLHAIPFYLTPNECSPRIPEYA